MTVILRYVMAAVFAASLWSCGGGHFITDKAYREKVHGDFLARKELAAGRAEALFTVFDRVGLTTAQREALEFLYAYMPLCDLSEYDGEYFLRQVDGAFRARDHFSWGASVPEDVFRHFVLVHRVNNEYMDDARDVFFEELKDRIGDMTMYDAALEVNHWCHEKVTYRGTDARTSSPLALMKTSWGRCGEESTFTVTALRAVGIPARQCYTPRWVHTDSNHAWVEVWIDGKWYYMGACEPEAELNAAWFDGPVQRAMMTHTTVYGAYNGPEDKNIETPLYSVINTLSNYAATRRAGVTVTDAEGNAVAGARVRFKVYNYAELYPIVTLQTDAQGRASLETGLGDLMIWADGDGAYGYVKSGAGDAEVTVALDRRPGEPYTETYVMSAPAEKPFKELPAEKIAANAVRLAREDSIRNAYMATFPTEEYARNLARETGLDEDRVWHNIHTAQGNWREMEMFIREGGEDALRLLATLREKDLRDTPADYLESYLKADRAIMGADYKGIVKSPHTYVDEIYGEVVSPRIGYELITPFRKFYPEKDTVSKRRSTPDPDSETEPDKPDAEEIIDFVRTNIRVSDWENYYNCRQTPAGVHTLRVADGQSRDIYFVAMCRAEGIHARLEPETGKPQYRKEWDYYWVNADFESEVSGSIVPAKGMLTVKNDPSNIVAPGYGSHFTIAVFRDGDFRTLDLDGYFTRTEESGPGRFPAVIPLEEGYYRMMAASRANDGSATVTAQYFTISKDRPHTATVKLPEPEGKLFVKGVVDMNSVIETDGGKVSLKSLAHGQGVVLCFADPDKEPTKHILQELPAHAATLTEWGGAVIFMVPDDKRTEAFDPTRFPEQPRQTVWAVDRDRELLNQTASALGIAFGNNFPLVVYLTGNGGIVFSSEGYRIGIIEDVVKTIMQERMMK